MTGFLIFLRKKALNYIFSQHYGLMKNLLLKISLEKNVQNLKPKMTLINHLNKMFYCDISLCFKLK